MFVPFNNLPSSSRVWVFQSNRPLTLAELSIAESKLREFTEGWAVHGSPFDTSYAIRHDQFFILAADESIQSASGCSIDSSVRVLKELEQALGIQLLDRSKVAFLIDGRVTLFPLNGLKEKFQEGILTEETLAFNNLVGSKGEFEKAWLAPAGSSWLRRYIPNSLAKVK
jgi:hypothetical protein